MRLPDEPEPPFQINIVPMIDVIFAILTFFIMSTLFLTRSEGLPVNLPGALTTESQPQSQIVVTIDRNGNLSLNRQPIEIDALESQVQEQITAGKQPVVVINADTDVAHGRVVAVMDRIREIEGARLAIATQQPQSSP